MKIHPINSIVKYSGHNTAGAASEIEKEEVGGQQQKPPEKTELSSANIKKDPARLPAQAQLATAHVARTLLAAQAENSEARPVKYFGQLVAQVAKDEQPTEIDPSSEENTNDIFSVHDADQVEEDPQPE